MSTTGKRFRSYITHLTYESLGGSKIEEIENQLMSLELLHLMALVHDDIIDKSPERRGVSTIETFAKTKLIEASRQGDLSHTALSHAILVGDLLFSWSQELMSTSYPSLSPDNHTKALKHYHHMIEELILGQMLDTDMCTRVFTNMESIEEKTAIKSGRYTFAHPMVIGGLLAGKQQEALTWCQEAGESLGMGFQISDDILDIISTKETLKKEPLSDIETGQHTIMTHYLLTHTDPVVVETFKKYFGKPIKKDEQKKVVTFFETTGALTCARNTAQLYFQKAQSHIDSAPILPTQKKHWNALITTLQDRLYSA